MSDSRIQHILVIDDDESIQQMVCDKLEYEGYEVWTANDGRHALEIIGRRGLPHLAIVDIHMPVIDGFEFCRIVHQYADLPIILLTAVDDEETIVRGIKNCAEDYVTKPFSPRQLAARVERVLHRIGSFAYALEPKVKIDDFLQIDLAHQEAVVNGEAVKLTPIENKILHILLCNAPRVVTTRFLLDRIWPHEIILEDVLRVHVHRLREKVERNSGSRRYILTERGLGYRFSKC
jgi:DNA-binding response OmpR family regulator